MTIEAKLRALRKTPYACVPDLEAALKATFSSSRYLLLKDFVVETTSVRRGPGRPRKDEVARPTIDSFWLADVDHAEDREALRQDELESACFVSATNATAEVLDSEAVLRTYLKDQQGVERSFRFLKDPEYFCDAFFLKNPSRVVALLCVMTMGLLLHALLQRKLRLELTRANATIPDKRAGPPGLQPSGGSTRNSKASTS